MSHNILYYIILLGTGLSGKTPNVSSVEENLNGYFKKCNLVKTHIISKGSKSQSRYE